MNVNHSNNNFKCISDKNKNNIRLVEQIDLFGIDIKILVTEDMTNNKYSLIELSFPAGPEKEFALPKHSKEDVTICVMEGNFVFRYGNKELKKDLVKMVLHLGLKKRICCLRQSIMSRKPIRD